MRWPRILAPLRHRDFRLLWLGQSVSRFGDAIYAVALPFQVLAHGASVLKLGERIVDWLAAAPVASSRRE